MQNGVVMDANFWHQKWANNQIGFHEHQANPFLVNHFNALSLANDSRVFVPLCGKTLDIGWLLAQGCQVAGAELSELAVTQLFAELGIEPGITDIGHIKHYSAPDIDIFVGDIFDVTREMLGPIDALYDRAALIALPEQMRILYARHMITLTEHAPQLLVTCEYDQSLMDGPPFSICSEEVQRHYQGSYDISLLASVKVMGGMRGTIAAKEDVWLLKPLEDE
jgi:thiopurine S-methyltransferase